MFADFLRNKELHKLLLDEARRRGFITSAAVDDLLSRILESISKNESIKGLISSEIRNLAAAHSENLQAVARYLIDQAGRDGALLLQRLIQRKTGRTYVARAIPRGLLNVTPPIVSPGASSLSAVPPVPVKGLIRPGTRALVKAKPGKSLIVAGASTLLVTKLTDGLIDLGKAIIERRAESAERKSDEIRDRAKEAVESDLEEKRLELRSLLSELFGERNEREGKTLDSMVNNTFTQAHSMSYSQSMLQAGVSEWEWVSERDSHTTEMCEFMSGRRFKVRDSARAISRFINAPDLAENIHWNPFFRSVGEIEALPDDEFARLWPPLHFNCRSRMRPVLN